MKPKCQACRAGPSGIVGHDGLLTLMIGMRGVVFRCSECETLWARWYAGEGRFEYVEVDPKDNGSIPPGVRLPTR